MKIKWVSREDLLSEGRRIMGEAEVVLDIGCGIQPQRYVIPAVHICCEPFLQYVEVLQEKIRNEYDRSYVVINGTWDAVLEILPKKSVDTVFILDVIEHLEKAAGERLLRATESLARRQLVVFTPLGFMPQCHADGKDAWKLDGGMWQEHKSGWQPEDFGEGWEFIACKDFHLADHSGASFPQPYGAFWAVRTFSEIPTTEAEGRRFLIESIRRNLSAIHNMTVLRDIGRLVAAVLRAKETPLRKLYKQTVERFRGEG